ncbi:MAG: M48 family metallopeptidase, partial [Proteobacteria bacterium]|nr:M48 family metallopeptidase [Pseudomonadota bacterium]
MNFFESQDIARRNTRTLLALFLLAVLSLVLLTNALVFVAINFDTARAATGNYYYNWQTFAVITLGVIGMIFFASLFRTLSLRKGGAAVAELMHGQLLTDHGGDFNKRKLLNVVEEMAIASSTPVPPVYLIPDQAINAFAAGYSPGDAVIGVTEGAMNTLSRDELQGVIAHEFSHILNGDMRLNIRLMGVLYGILMMAILGRILLSSGRGSRGRNEGGIAAFGLGLVIVGYLGHFFGNLIKAAVSRQREFLADASAVQYTRNPDGIAGALKRIGGYAGGTVMADPESEELSHSLFCQGVKAAMFGAMATHPPLEERIRRLDPSWQGEFLNGPPTQETAARAAGAMGFAGAAGVTLDAEQIVEQVGNPTEARLDTARRILGAIPEALADAAHEPYSSRAIVYLMQLHASGEIRDKQLEHLKASADLGVYDALEKLLPFEPELVPAMRLPLLEMCLPSLRQLSYEQYKLFLGNLDALIRADRRVTLQEWAVQKMVQKHLGSAFEGKRSRAKYNRLSQVQDHCAVLLSMLALSDRDAAIEPAVAFAAGLDALELNIELQDKNSLSFARLNDAVDTLADLHPLRKPKLLKACVRTITADGIVSDVEAELLRAVADLLECPVPPLDFDQA